MSIRTFTMNSDLPMLYIAWPQCGHCLEDVHIEDGAAYCEHCRVQWDRVSEDANVSPDENLDGSEVPCGIIAGEQSVKHSNEGITYTPGPPKPCILPSGHDSDHLCPYDVEVQEQEEEEKA